MRDALKGPASIRWFALLLVLMLTAACGGDGANGEDTPPPEVDNTVDDTNGDDDTTQEADGEPISLGGVVDQTAYLADFDAPVREGINLAIESLNDDGGVLDGRPLQIDFVDMEADPAQGIRAIQRHITDDVAAILHGFTSASTRAGQSVLAENELPMITASVLPEEEEYVFSTIPPARFEMGIRADYLLEQGITQIGVLNDGTPYSDLQLEHLQTIDEITVVGAEQHTPDAVDLRPLITSLLQAGAEAILKISAGPTNIVAAQAMTQIGTDVPLITGIDNVESLEQAAGLYDNFFTVASPPQAFDVIPEGDRSESLVSFMEMHDEGGLSGDPTYIGRGWDAVFLIASAIEDAGSADSADIAASLESMEPYEGVSGTFDFGQDSHYGFQVNPYYIAEFTDDGSLEIVYMPDGS